MKLLSLLFTVLTVLIATVLAWEKEDHEIFDLVTELEAAEGKGTTFYSWLDVPSTASTNDIAKAYRKKSMLLHPDKNPNVKGVHERFARLGVISTILRNKEGRERYDFFYKNGVPKWRGTGYYYSRFRPGLGFVFVFLIILTSGLQYLVQRINYKRDLQRIERIVGKAKAAAWGPKMIPVNGKRKVKVNLGDARDGDGEYTGTKWLDMVVENSQVFLLDPSGEIHLIDESTAIRPAIKSTWFIAVILSVVNRFAGPRQLHAEKEEYSAQNGGTTTNYDVKPNVDSDGTSSDAADSEASTSKKVESRVKMPTVKAGGMRRKNLRKR